MNPEPMMPKACSMPCICKTFTNASSVVIFIATSFTQFSSYQLPSRDLRPHEPLAMNSRLFVKYLSEFAGGMPERRQVPPRSLLVHACLRCLDGEGGEHLAVLADHRHRHANHTDKIFLAVEGDLLFADSPQLSIEPRTVGPRAFADTPELQPFQQPPPSP